MWPHREGAGMLRDRTVLGSLAVGAAAAAVAVGYGVATDLVRVPEAPGVPFAAALVFGALVVVPLAVSAGSAYLAFRYRVVSPLVLVGVFAALPGVLGWNADQVLVGVLVVGPFVVVAGLGDALVRARLGELADPPSEAGYRALSVGVTAAVLYFGAFALRAALPLWRLDSGAPRTLPPEVDLALLLWYVFGVSLVLVGVPVALNRRYGLVAPLFGLFAYLLVELAFVQPLVAEGAEPLVVLLVAVWPLLAALLAAVGAVEWWVRRRRGDYDEPEEGDEGGEGGGLTLEGGLLGDRV